mmetsp:Transcript_42775/g.67026  ORF Transcript_42775/g.67026 Transcript_42775/m.67026 type:complete len:304 (-) Transcript_42775:426-1337(-)
MILLPAPSEVHKPRLDYSGTASIVRVAKLIVRVALDEHGNALSPGSAGSDNTKLSVLVPEAVRSPGDEPGAGGTERMTDRERSSSVVHFALPVDESKLLMTQILLAPALRVHGIDVGQNLSGERLVELPNVNVVDSQVVLLEKLGGGVGGAKQQLILGVLGNENPVLEGKLAGQSIGLGLLLSHDDGGGSSIGQVRSVSSGDCAVGLHEGGFELAELLHGGSTDAIVLGDHLILGAVLHGHDLLIEVALVGELLSVQVGAATEIVLLRARHAEGLSQAVSTVSHNLAGGEFSNPRRLGGEIAT